MTISDVSIRPAAGGFDLLAAIKPDGKEVRHLLYECRGGAEQPSLEMAGATVLAAAIPTAVALAENLELKGICDADFLRRSDDLARAKARLHRLPQRISVSGQASIAERKPNRVVACSFSGGVDSLFSVQKHTKPGAFDPLGALVTVFGIDLRYNDDAGHAREFNKLRRFSEELEVPHYTVKTNFREVFDDLADWSLFTHGSCVMSCGFALSGSVHTYLVPCSASIDRLYPWGSHALLDNAFVASEFCIKNDAWEWHRNEKVAEVATWPLAMQNMRVCNKMRPQGNCCDCEKCVRTMALLMLEGRLGDATCFEKRLTYSDLASFRIKKDAELFWFGQMAKEARVRGLSEMEAALNKCLRSGRLRVARRTLIKSLLGRSKKPTKQHD